MCLNVNRRGAFLAPKTGSDQTFVELFGAKHCVEADAVIASTNANPFDSFINLTTDQLPEHHSIQLLVQISGRGLDSNANQSERRLRNNRVT